MKRNTTMKATIKVLGLLIALTMALAGCDARLLSPVTETEAQGTSLTVSVLPAMSGDEETTDASASSRALMSADQITVSIAETATPGTAIETHTVNIAAAGAGANFDFVVAPAPGGTSYTITATVYKTVNGTDTPVSTGSSSTLIYPDSRGYVAVYPIPTSATPLTAGTASASTTLAPSSVNEALGLAYGGEEAWFTIGTTDPYLEVAIDLADPTKQGILAAVFDSDGQFIEALGYGYSNSFTEVVDLSRSYNGGPYYIGLLAFENDTWNGFNVRTGGYYTWIDGHVASGAFTITATPQSTGPTRQIVAENLENYNAGGRVDTMFVGDVWYATNFSYVVRYDDKTSNGFGITLTSNGSSDTSVITITEDAATYQTYMTAVATGTATIAFTYYDYDAGGEVPASAEITVAERTALSPGRTLTAQSVPADGFAYFTVPAPESGWARHTVTTANATATATADGDIDLFLYDDPYGFGDWTEHSSSVVGTGAESVTAVTMTDDYASWPPQPTGPYYVFVANPTSSAISFDISLTNEALLSSIGDGTVGEILEDTLLDFAASTSQPFGEYRYADTDTGIQGILAGTYDVAGSLRVLDTTETTAGAMMTTIGRMPYLIVVNASGVTDIASSDLTGIFTGAITDWDTVTGGTTIAGRPITIFSYDTYSEHYSNVVNAFLGGITADYFYPSDQTLTMIEDLAATPDSIAYIPWSQQLVVALTAGADIVSIDGAAPLEANVADGTYPLSLPLGIVTADGSTLAQSAAASAFLSYIGTTDGKVAVDSAVQARGFVPAP